MWFDEMLATLHATLGGPLPGAGAHARMAPRPGRDWPTGFDIEHIRHAAGLLLLVPQDERAHVVLTVRAQTLDRHGGQVSLPGGVIERGETLEQAALRETHEEIGVAAADVRLLGALTPIDIAVSGFRLHPVVGVATITPRFRPATGEVDRILNVPVAELLESTRIVWRSTTRDGRTFEYPVFPHQGTEIWGATAMVLAEFLTLLGWTGPSHNV